MPSADARFWVGFQHVRRIGPVRLKRLIDRFGSIDKTDGGHTYRYSVGGEWQHGSGQTLSKIQAYGLGYDLGLISNFTFFLDDPVRGDQREQLDHRFVSGVRAFQKRQTRWGGRPVENTFGVQFRNDDVMQVALYHTEARQRLETVNDASAIVSSLSWSSMVFSLLRLGLVPIRPTPGAFWSLLTSSSCRWCCMSSTATCDTVVPRGLPIAVVAAEAGDDARADSAGAVRTWPG